jgi:hypothetical protein
MSSNSAAPRAVQGGLVFVCLFLFAASAAAQGVTVSGRLYHSVNLKPVAGATVLIEAQAETKSTADGVYSIANVPAGTYHLLVVAPGFMPTRAELTVAQAAVARCCHRSGAALLGGRVGQPRRAQPVRFLSADVRPRGAGSCQQGRHGWCHACDTARACRTFVRARALVRSSAASMAIAC